MTCFILSNGMNLHQYCKKTGKCYCAIWNRIENGWSLEEAVGKPLMAKNGTKYFINGKSARSQMTKNEYQRYTKKLRKESK